MTDLLPRVLARDDPFVFLSKPVGMVSVPGRASGQERGVAAWLQHELALASLPFTCHRLDRQTSGVMVLALDEDAHRAAGRAFERHEVRKAYVALVAGALDGVRVVDAPLGPDEDAPRDARGRQAVDGLGKSARTILVPLASNHGMTLVAARPSTGRTHQIRAHLQHVGLPIHGDTLYGGAEAPRLMLHAARLSFFALGGERAAECTPGEDFASVLTAHGLSVPAPADMDAALTRAARGGR